MLKRALSRSLSLKIVTLNQKEWKLIRLPSTNSASYTLAFCARPTITGCSKVTTSLIMSLHALSV